MNATVKRIVDLLFEDVEMTNEVQAIREELMNNCQERFQDLTAAGQSEDEAIGAVVESLRGMEEVLKDYPRKEADGPCSGEGDAEHVFPAAEVTKIAVSTVESDVHMMVSKDEHVHVKYSRENMSRLNVSCEGGTLRIEEGMNPRGKSGGHKFVFDVKMDDVKINSLEDIGRLLRSIRLNAEVYQGGMVTIAVPEGCAPEVTISTTSGDVEMELEEKKLPAVRCSTVSGDVELDVDASHVAFKTISGDADVRCTSDRVRSITGNTVSGEITISLPEEVEARVSAKTVSGKVSQEINRSAPHTAEVTLKSISGNIHIR